MQISIISNIFQNIILKNIRNIDKISFSMTLEYKTLQNVHIGKGGNLKDSLISKIYNNENVKE